MSTLEALRRGDLAGAKEIRLPGLSEFPPELFGLSDTLELLDIGNGSLTELPADLGRFRKLRILFCSGNRFTQLPRSLGDCAALMQIGCRGAGVRDVPGEALPPSLRWLILTDNQIETLPRVLGERPQLQKLMLAGNRLTSLPESVADLSKLELIRVSANRFDTVPALLSRLPSLAWISWAGNPFEPDLPMTHTREISWRDLEVGPCLGEGTSGHVHRALLRRDESRPRRNNRVEGLQGCNDERRSSRQRNHHVPCGRPASKPYSRVGPCCGSSRKQGCAADAAASSALARSGRPAQSHELQSRRLRVRPTARARYGRADRARRRVGGRASPCPRPASRRSVRAQHPVGRRGGRRRAQRFWRRLRVARRRSTRLIGAALKCARGACCLANYSTGARDPVGWRSCANSNRPVLKPTWARGRRWKTPCERWTVGERSPRCAPSPPSIPRKQSDERRRRAQTGRWRQHNALQDAGRLAGRLPDDDLDRRERPTRRVFEIRRHDAGHANVDVRANGPIRQTVGIPARYVGRDPRPARGPLGTGHELDRRAGARRWKIRETIARPLRMGTKRRPPATSGNA